MAEEKKQTKDEQMQTLLKLVQQLHADVQALKQEREEQPVARAHRAKGQPRPDVHYVVLGYPVDGFPPQCKRIMRVLSENVPPETKTIDEPTAYALLMGPEAKIGNWSYRQDPWYVFRYYRGQMIGADYLKMK